MRKKQGNAIKKKKLGITKSLENLAILRRCGHFL